MQPTRKATARPPPPDAIMAVWGPVSCEDRNMRSLTVSAAILLVGLLPVYPDVGPRRRPARCFHGFQRCVPDSVWPVPRYASAETHQ